MRVEVLKTDDRLVSVAVKDGNDRTVGTLEVYRDPQHPYRPAVYASSGSHDRAHVNPRKIAPASG